MEQEKYNHLKATLTRREFDICRCMLGNMSFEEIAKELFIAESTIRKHASNMYAKLGLKNKNTFLGKYLPDEQREKINRSNALIETKLNEAVDMTWDDNNHFDQYYAVFSEVISAMCQLDFSKRIEESNDKKSLINFFAQSLNMVNDELDLNFVSAKVITSILNLLKEPNRIVLVSKDRQTIMHCYDTISKGTTLGKTMEGKRIDAYFGETQLSAITSKSACNFITNFSDKNFPFPSENDADVCAELYDDYLIITIDLAQENHLSNQMPRILSLLSCIKSQYDDNPDLANTVLGKTVSTEINSLFKELDKFVSIAD